MRLGIVTALRSEAHTLGAASGCWGGNEFVVEVCGPGQDRARKAAIDLVGAGCDALLSWGLAGGLEPDLRPGDVVIANRVIDGMSRTIDTDRMLAQDLARRLAAQNPRRGAVLSVTAPLSRAIQKSAGHERSAALAVDMESAGIAGIARGAGRAFAAIRAIVDPADFEVPGAALAGVGQNGATRPFDTFTALLKAPAELPALLRLARHYRSAIESLGRCATDLETVR